MVRSVDELRDELRVLGVSSKTLGAVLGETPSMIRQRLNGYCPLFPEQRHKIETYISQLRQARAAIVSRPKMF